MLAKKNRLNLSLKQNSSIFEKGNSFLVGSKFFLAYLRSNQDSFKVTCLTPKVALTKATLRNHYRRFIYSLVEEKIQEKKLTADFKIDLVIILKKNFTENKDDLREDFSDLIQKILAKINKNNEQAF